MVAVAGQKGKGFFALARVEAGRSLLQRWSLQSAYAYAGKVVLDLQQDLTNLFVSPSTFLSPARQILGIVNHSCQPHSKLCEDEVMGLFRISSSPPFPAKPQTRLQPVA